MGKDELIIEDDYIDFTQVTEKDHKMPNQIRIYKSHPDTVTVVVSAFTELSTSAFHRGLKKRSLYAAFSLDVETAKKIYEFVKKELT